MNAANKIEYDDAATRANALSDASEGTPAAAELAGLVSVIRAWDDAHQDGQSNGPEEVTGLTRPDDLSISGLPGNLGKLHAD